MAHPLLVIGVILAAPVVAVTHASTDWPAFITALTGLFSAGVGAVFAYLNYKSNRPAPKPSPTPKRKGRP